MVLIGAAVNAAAIFAGSLLGLIFRKGIPERVQSGLNNALALCVLFIGIQGCLKGEKPLVTALSLAVGSLIGAGIDIDKQLNRFGSFLQKKVAKNSADTFGQGFVSAMLFTCVGAMAIVGAIEAGMQNSFDTYYAKALLDGVFILIMTAAMGFGCFFSGFVVFAYEALLTMAASFVSVFLTESMIAEMSCVGSIIVIAIALNTMQVTKIKIGNLLPSAFMPLLLCLFM